MAADDKKAAAEKITYADHVLPILENRCLNCHNPDEAKGGLDLSSYGATLTGGSGGEVVISEDSGSSRLYTLMAHIETPKMPPEKPKSPDKELEIFKKWIDGGLLETANSKAKKSTKPKLDMSNMVTSIGKPEIPAMPEHLILEPELVTDRPNTVPAIAHSPWAPILAVAGQKQVLLYHSEDFDLLGVLPYPEGFPQSLNFSSNGSLLSCGGGRGGKSGSVVAWDVKTGERVIEVGKEFDIVLGSDISADHRRVVMGGPGKNIKIWDTVAGEQVSVIKKHSDWMLTADISPDGVLFATGGRNSGLFIWETGTGMEFYTLKGHTKAVTDLAWRPDGNAMASVSEDGQAIIWEMNEGKQVKKWVAHAGGALAIDIAPDGTIATAGRDKTVKIWKADGAALKTIAASDDIVMSVAFSQDSKRVISGDYAGNIKVWNIADGVQLGSLDPNPPRIDQQIAYSTKRIAEVRGSIPKLQEGIKVAAAELVNAKQKFADINKTAGEAAAKKGVADTAVKTLDGQVKSFTAQIDAAKKILVAKQADAKAKTDAYNAQVAAQAKAKAEVAKWTPELQKADVALKAAVTNLAAAKAAAEKPVLDAATQTALNAAVGVYNAADAAEKAADAKIAPAKAADDAANPKLAAANAAKNDAAAKLAQADEAGKPAAQNVLNVATAAQLQAQNAKNVTAKLLADATAAAAVTNKKLADAGIALKPLRDKEVAGKVVLEKAKQLFAQRITEHALATKALAANKGQLDNATKNLAAVDVQVKATLAARDAANGAVAAVNTDVAAKSKLLADSAANLKVAQAEAAKAIALVANLTKQKDAGTKLVAAVQKKEADAKMTIVKAEKEVKTNEFLVKKFEAAAINLEAKNEGEELVDMKEELEVKVVGVSEASEEFKSATMARVEAEKTLANAKKTVDEGNKELKMTSTNVLEKAMRLAAARAVAEVREDVVIAKVASDVEPDSEANPDAVDMPLGEIEGMPIDPENVQVVAVAADGALAEKSREEIESEIVALRARLQSLEGVIRESYTKADKTKETVMKASDVAAKTPGVIAERTKVETMKGQEKTQAENEKVAQEKAVTDQTSKVETLKKKYIESVPKREEIKAPIK